MKSSYTKRALAFWLAVAMVATSAPMAFATASTSPTSTMTETSGVEPLELEKKSLESADITLENSSYTYTGTEIKPKVKTVTVDNIQLEEETDYTVRYSDNVNAGTAKVIITGAGNYTGKKEKTFTIDKADLTIQPAKQSVPIATGVDKVLETLQSTAVKGVGNETVTGTFTITAVESKGALPEKAALNGEITKGNFTQSSGKYEVTASFKPESTNYNEKNDIKFECDVTGKEEQTLTFDAPSIDKTYGEGVFTNLAKSDHDNAGVIKYSSSNEDVATVDADTGAVTVVGVGTTTIKAHTDGTATYLPDDTRYELTVKAKDISATATIADIEAKTYTGEELKPELTVKDGETLLKKGTDYDVVYTDNVFPGTATATVTFKGNYTGTAKKTFEIQKATYNKPTGISQSVVAGQNAVLTIPVDLANAEITNYSSITVDGTDASIVDGTPSRDKNVITAKIKSGATNTQTANVKITLTTKGYGDVTLTYTLTVSDSKKQLTSSQINFVSKTVTADGKTYFKLDNASLKDVTDTKGKWTYALKGVSTLSEQSEMPSFKDAGVYTIVASYQGDKYVGSKEATLTIKPAESSNITIYAVAQLSSRYDDNYSYFNVRLRDEKNGYARVRADANDYLVKQKIDGTSSEWIGMTVEPKIGSSRTTDGLWIAFSKNGTWYKRSDSKNERNGDIYITDVDGDSFDLWFETEDRDCSESIYLATDKNGSNKFELYVDFDSYSGSSSSSSGSSSSDTSKVNGDRVSTTTVDKTPSVKNGSATVTFSSSALSDALDANKKEAKREDADKTYIELDVKTSKSVDDTTITVPRSSLDKIADEDTGLKLTTNQGTVTFDYRALAEIYDACDKTNIEFYLEEEDDDQYVLLIKDGSSDVIDLGRGSVEVTFDYKLKSGEKSSDVKVYRIGNGDKTWLATYGGSTVYGAADVYAAAPTYVTDMKADYSSSKKKVTFTTDALGTFLITTDTLKTGSGSTTTTPTYNAFVDVPSSRWSATYINKLASLGIINGTGGGYFEPTLYVTREEFVKMLAGVAGANVNGYTSSRFPDVSLSRWSAPYIAWAADRGITTGTDGGNFAPTMRITREEMATMIYRYVQSSGKTLPAKNAPVIFADANLISGWAQTPVSVMQQAGIIDGNVTNGRYTFDPKVSASREECAKMLAVLYDLVR